ncbi:4'-phosphopantetheinyl transferase family protein [Kitasatospora sp. NPDC052868]|uniref:4'-phosphopantetheinyl transferase family protein n=1 Tax=Kitasatospora sp. NPDC052868 TaxID=3364060 RepID=UPI0037C5313A
MKVQTTENHTSDRARILVLTSRSAAVLARVRDPLAALTPAERRRAAAIPDRDDRDTFTAAHLLARIAAAEVLGTDPEDVTIRQECEYCTAEHGRPSIPLAPDLAVGWSHTRGGWVAAAAGAGPLGVDVETTPARHSPALARRALAPAEYRWMREAPDPGTAFLDLWVRKEALIKVGRLTLGTLARADLIGKGLEPMESWGGFRLVPVRRGPLVGACALPGPAADRLTVRHL